MSIVGRATVGAWISQRHCTGDSARTISNDRDCWRRLMAGTALAGGLALASVAAGPATAGDHDHDHDHGGGIIHCGLLDGLLNNSGTVTNNCIHIGALNNTGAAGVVTNSAIGTWIGDLLSNTGGATVKNIGTWTGDANNASTVVNSGIWNTTANGFTNSGTLITTGTLNAALGGLINTGIVDAQGVIRGNITNIGLGTFTVTGPLSAGGGNFRNGKGAVLNVGANIFNDIGTLTNSAGGIVNLAGGTIGAITTVNAGTLNASGLSTINGALTNSGLINLQNNVAGDRLTVTGSFTGSAGSTIALDINARTGIADQIVINGSATGSTTLNVAGLVPGNPFTIGPNLVVVQGAASLNAFVLGNVLNLGTLVEVLLALPNGTGLSFAPATIASSTGLSGSVATSAAQTASHISNDAVFDRMSSLHNSIRGGSSPGAAGPATAYVQEFAKDDPISPYVRAVLPPLQASQVRSRRPGSRDMGITSSATDRRALVLGAPILPPTSAIVREPAASWRGSTRFGAASPPRRMASSLVSWAVTPTRELSCGIRRPPRYFLDRRSERMELTSWEIGSSTRSSRSICCRLT